MSKPHHFSFPRIVGLRERIQVITLLKAFYSDDWDRITLYLDKIDRMHLQAGTFHTKATVRAVFDEADFNEFIFKEDL